MTSQSVLTLEPKLQPHLGSRAQVPRTRLLDLLEASSRTPVAAILAPPGYGKTTLLAQLAGRDPRAFGWLTIDGRDNDPAVLLRNLAAAFERIAPGRALVEAAGAAGSQVADALLAQLGSALSAAEVRLLRLLGTHYSFREIGVQLYLSQHTVKSQAMSIYRKFGVSSRSEAIGHARDLGLLVE